MHRLAAGLVALAALAGAADAQVNRLFRDGPSHMYFWEDPYRYGWSDSPQPTFGAPAPRILKRNVTLTELCARQVGRMLRIDSSSLIVSTQMTDACIRNGGRLR
jgi:hypothetical protein